MTSIEQLAATQTLRDWASPLTTLFRIALIVGVAFLVHVVVSRFIRGVRVRIASHMQDNEQVRRAETLGRVFRYFAAVVIATFAAILVLGELGVSVVPFLGAAGVVGLAIGFGAQSLVKDYFTGVLLLIEGQITKGDIVQVADKAGVVEDMTLRYVQLRDYNGHLHFVPNGQIASVTNMTRGHAYAVIDAGVAYREDLQHVHSVVRRTAAALAADPEYRDRVLAEFEIAGVERWDDSAIIIRGRFKVRPLEQWSVRREMLRRLKNAFDAEGIEIPYPHMTLYAGESRAGKAPPFRVDRAADDRAASP